jgi:hypothetical protein
MLNHPFFHPDPPPGSPGQVENPGEGSTEESPPTGYEIAGERYTEEEIESALAGAEAVRAERRENEASYTRQTQDIAAKRREVEEMEARANALLSQAERELGSNPLDETVPGLGKELDSIKQTLSQLTQAQQTEAQIRADRDAETERAQAVSAAVNSLDGRPFINDESKAEVRAFMERNNLAPNQVGMAYNAMYGPQIGEERGFQRAVREGAQAGPPQIGAGATSVSPGFTTPQEVPGVEQDVGDMSWDDMKRAALNDPEKPKFG